MLLIASCVAIGSQFQLNFFVQGFIITLSVIIFPILLYFYNELDPLKTAVLTAFVSPAFRGFVMYMDVPDLSTTVALVWPDASFYVAYGLLFSALYYRRSKKNLTTFIMAVFCCDFLSNIVEMLVRTKIMGMDLDIVKGLAIIAAVRTLIVLGAIIGMKYYNRFLIKEEHEARYRKLIMTTAQFKSESYFMYKNMAEIEDVMKKSFSAYKYISENNYPDEIKNLSLDIAKDIHEIKKEYIRAVRGLEEMSRGELNIDAMSILDLMELLEIETKEHIRRDKLDISISFMVERNFVVGLHFYMMSVLKNLVSNSIEAMEGKTNGKIRGIVRKKMDEYTISIWDNGPGIKESNLEYIFNPGFSTKFDKDTGNIGRGIGLSLVKDLVEKEFGGRITVESKEGRGTTFTITLPAETISTGVERKIMGGVQEEGTA